MALLLNILDSHLSLDLVIWSFPVAFLIHDLEELVTMERFSRENQGRFPPFLRRLAVVTTTQFLVAMLVLLVLTIIAAYLATRSPREPLILTLSLSIFLVHVLGHFAFPIYFRQYTPGLITAVLIVLPYSLYAFYRLGSAHLTESRGFAISLLLGALLVAPLIWLALFIGKWIAHCFQGIKQPSSEDVKE